MCVTLKASPQNRRYYIEYFSYCGIMRNLYYVILISFLTSVLLKIYLPLVLIDIFMIFSLYYISCTYVKRLNCMVLGYKQYNT